MTPLSARPLMALPCVAIHGKIASCGRRHATRQCACDLKASRSRITERVGGGISALEPDLVRPFALEWDEEVGSDRKPAVRINVHLRDPSANSLRIELRVDGGI